MISKIIKDAENKAKTSINRQMNDLGLSEDEKQKEEHLEEPIEDDTFSLLKTIVKKIGEFSA